MTSIIISAMFVLKIRGEFSNQKTQCFQNKLGTIHYIRHSRAFMNTKTESSRGILPRKIGENFKKLLDDAR